MERIRHMPQVFSTVYEEENLTLRFEGTGSHLLSLLRYMEEEHLTCAGVFPQLPTLNDVFLEITGKELERLGGKDMFQIMKDRSWSISGKIQYFLDSVLPSDPGYPSFILPWEGLWEDMPWKTSRQLLSRIRVQIPRRRKPFLEYLESFEGDWFQIFL